MFADLRAFTLTNVFTALSWLSYFQSLRFLEPAITNVLFAGVGPLTIAAMSFVGWRIVDPGRMSVIEVACQTAMALCLAVLVAIALLGLAADGGGVSALTGCAFAVFAGVGITIATLYAKRLHDAGASAAAVVSTRFIGVLVAAALALSFGPAESRAAALSSAVWLSLAPAAFVFMAVPIYLNQVGVKLANPLTVRVLLALGPMFVIVLQTVAGSMPLSGYSLAGVSVYCAIAIGAALARMFNARAESAPAQA